MNSYSKSRLRSEKAQAFTSKDEEAPPLGEGDEPDETTTQAQERFVKLHYCILIIIITLLELGF